MKIQIDKRNMVALLDAMLLKNAVQEAELEAALDTCAELEDGEESKGELNRKVERLKGRLAEESHLSFELRVALAKAGREIFLLSASAATMQELREKNEAQAAEMDAMREKIEQWKGEVLKDKERTYDLSDLQRQFSAGVEHGKRVRDREAAGEPTQPQPEPEAVVGTTPSPEAPGEAAAWQDIALRRHETDWLSSHGDFTLYEVMERTAKEAYEAGVNAGQGMVLDLNAAWEAERERKADVPQKVHLLVFEHPHPRMPTVIAYADYGMAAAAFAQFTLGEATYHHVSVVPKGKEVEPMT